MGSDKAAFIRLAIACDVLKFGDFTLKSGRKSPYFFNAGLFYDGHALRELGRFYAKALQSSGIAFHGLFGPAYKGLPLATATAIALAEDGIQATVTFNRKEAKDHGEGGNLIGAPLKGDVVIIDDVITAGTAFREARALIDQSGARLSGVVIALDRCERGLHAQSTLQEIAAEGTGVASIINFFDLTDYLQQQGETAKIEAMFAYHRQYGV